MNQIEAQQEITLIKQMIEKTKKDTADSGYFLIFIGIFTIITTFAIGMLEFYNLNHLVFPMMIVMLIGGAIIGYLTTNKTGKNEHVSSYHKMVCYSIWFACAVPAILITFLFPLFDLYPFALVPVFVSLIMGIAVFATGIIFESHFVYLSSIIWWAGAIIMAFSSGYYLMYILIAIIFFGWVLPGFILNRQYKKRRSENGA